MGGLPPSKSHLIRWLLLASQGENSVEIHGIEGASQDACAMRDALIELGVEIEIENDIWTVHGVGVNGFNQPSKALDFQNSGTALRLLTMAVHSIPLYGDAYVPMSSRCQEGPQSELLWSSAAPFRHMCECCR